MTKTETEVGGSWTTRHPLQAGIDRFAFKGQNAKDAFMHTAKRFLANETLQGFNPKGELSQSQGVNFLLHGLSPHGDFQDFAGRFQHRRDDFLVDLYSSSASGQFPSIRSRSLSRRSSR
jgi:hypothetical protein